MIIKFDDIYVSETSNSLQNLEDQSFIVFL
jgi:hypothetical protein